MTPYDLDDRELLQAHVNGDPVAFGELARRHRDRLWGVAMRTLRDREEAADAVQDALISAMRNAAGYRGEAAVSTWLHRIVVNACLDRMRRERARPRVPLGDVEFAARGDDHALAELRLDLRAALSRLPEPQRAAIVLVDLLEWSVADAAVELGVAEGTIKSRCSRGRTELARILRERPTPPATTAPPPTMSSSGMSSPGMSSSGMSSPYSRPVQPLVTPGGNRRFPSDVAGADVWPTGLSGPAPSGGGS